MLKFSMILQAVDRASAPARRMEASMKRLGAAAKRYARDLADPAKAEARGAAIGTRLRSGLDRLAGGFARVGRAAKRWAGKAGLGSWGDAAEMAGRGVGSLIRKGAGLAASAAKWAGAAAVAAGGFALFDLFGTASKFEQYQVMLENMEGSAEAAGKAFDWVKQFAATTPYELADVMEAFVSLKAYGIDPMNGSLMALGDAAAGMSKPVGQAVEALSDAITGEYERLKEFGIRASKQGDQVSFTYRKAGKDITKTVKATGAAIEGAITGIFTDRFGGMMAKQSRTMAGMISNLKDSWSNFLMMVADAGIFDLVKGKIALILTRVNEWAKNGKLKAWAENVSTWLERAFNWAWQLVVTTDWNALVANMQAIAQAAVVFAEAILKIAQNIGTISNALGIWSGRGGQALITPTASGEKPYFDQLKDKFRSSKKPEASTLFPVLGKPRAGIPFKGATNDVKVGGKAVVDIRVTGPAQASLRQTTNGGGNVPFQFNLGKTMLDAA